MAALRGSPCPWVPDAASDLGTSVSDFNDTEDGLELATSLLAALDALEAEDVGFPGSAKRKHDDDSLTECPDDQAAMPFEFQGSFKRSRSMDKRDLGVDDRQQQRPKSPLRGIPAEVALKILSCLSAADLALCGQVCKAFRDCAAVDTLWKRLYLFRWGPATQSEGRSGEKTWKTLYGEKDTVEMEETVAVAPLEAVEMYSEKQRTKRRQSLGVGQIAELTLGIADQNLGQLVLEWLKSHGFPEVPRTRIDLCCSSGPYVQIGDAFVCEKCGYVHICGEHCREYVVDPATNSLVCPISGRSADWPMAEYDVFAMTGGMAEDGVEELKGRLGRACVAGYNCSNESELRRFCGMQLS